VSDLKRSANFDRVMPAYYLHINELVQGPYSEAEVRNFFVEKTLLPDSLISADGGDWQRLADSLPHFFTPPAAPALPKRPPSLPLQKSAPPPLRASINVGEPESGHATRGFVKHWKLITVAIVVGGIFLVGEGEWREKRFLELLGGAAMGAVFVCFGLLVKLSSWIESQGGFKKAWGVIFAGKSRRGDSRSVLKKKP
jgi:hypothetical protein